MQTSKAFLTLYNPVYISNKTCWVDRKDVYHHDDMKMKHQKEKAAGELAHLQKTEQNR